MDLKTKCHIIATREKEVMKIDVEQDFYQYDKTLKNICEDVDNWINKPTLRNYLEPIVNNNINVEFWEHLTEPLNTRQWKIAYDNRGAEPRRDIIYLRGQIGADYYVYVHDQVNGAYGTQFEVAIDGGNTLSLLPTIKQFTDELKVGKCFIVTFEKVIEFGNNRKKYCYDIQEISEQEYLDGVVEARLRHFAW